MDSLTAQKESPGFAAGAVTANYQFNHTQQIDFNAIAAAALKASDSVLRRWLPGGRRRGPEYIVRNPRRDDRAAGSFSVNVETGRWSEFATGDKGGDLVSLVAYLEGGTQGKAANALSAFLGLDPIKIDRENRECREPAPRLALTIPEPPGISGSGRDCQPNEQAVPVMPVPTDAPAAPTRHPRHGSPGHTWTYNDASARALFHVCRFDPAGEGKQFSPLSLWREGTGLRWHWKAVPAPRSLYGLDRLAARPDAPVVVCEGEKACDAAGALLPNSVSVTSPNGAASAGKAEWSALKGRRVFIWPDADEPGTRYAADVARLVAAVGAVRVKILRLGSLAALRGSPLPEGYDAADALTEDVDRDALRALFTEPANWTDANKTIPAVDLSDELIEVDQNAERAVQPDAKQSPGQAPRARFERYEGKPGFRSGIYWIGLGYDKKTASYFELAPAWICSPLTVAAVTRDERGGEWGRLLQWNDRDRRTHRWAMPMSLTAASCEELRAELLREGLEITSDPNARRRLVDYITGERPEITARCVSRAGWHNHVFVLPRETFGDTDAEPVFFQSNSPEGIALGQSGTLEGWRENVAAPCAGNSRLVMALCCAFAAPCLGLLGAEGGGVHFRGATSEGKTTALAVAGSMFGRPEIPGYLRTWRNTDNALEGVAALHSDLLLILDELGQLDPKHAGSVAYMLANGQGKGRAHRDGSPRAAPSWRTLFLSAGEIGLAELIVQAGGKICGGQEVRVLDIPADAGAGLGLFERVPAGTTPGAFADGLKSAALKNYGHALPAWLRILVDERDASRELLREMRDALAAELAPDDAAGQVRRVAQRFAMVAAAGELATAKGLTGWQPDEAERAVRACFAAWVVARGTKGASEPAAMLAQVRGFFEAHGESKFALWEHSKTDKVTINRAGFRRAGEGGNEFFVFREAFRRELCAGFDHTQVARVLAARGALLVGSSNESTRKEALPDGTSMRVYRIGPKLWDDAP